MHDGPRTDYDKELVAQGVGNTVCGVLGALPMTAVIVRSSANVQAGARTKASRILHGAVAAAVRRAAAHGDRDHPARGARGRPGPRRLQADPRQGSRAAVARAPRRAVILAITAVPIVATSMFEGVVLGLVLAVVKTAWETSHSTSTSANSPAAGWW